MVKTKSNASHTNRSYDAGDRGYAGKQSDPTHVGIDQVFEVDVSRAETRECHSLWRSSNKRGQSLRLSLEGSMPRALYLMTDCTHQQPQSQLEVKGGGHCGSQFVGLG